MTSRSGRKPVSSAAYSTLLSNSRRWTKITFRNSVRHSLVLLDPDETVDIFRVFRTCRAKFDEVRHLASNLKSEIDTAIRRALVLQVNRNNSFLDELAAFLDTLGTSPERLLDEWDVQSGEDDEDDADDDERAPRTGRRGAEVACRRAVRTQARAMGSGRSLRKGTTTEKSSDGSETAGLLQMSE